MLYFFLKKYLFSLDPERAHDVTLESLNFAHRWGLTKTFKKIHVPQIVMGLSFPNPVGLAAGLDKNGDYIDALASLGFGFIEIGTVTPKPQEGNPKPRLFRLTEQKAIINRMGFNNKGLDYVVQRLQQKKFSGILGVNIGKNRDTQLDHAVDDYRLGFQRVAPYASYVTINISSPNTAGLRDLQHGEFLRELLKQLKHEQTLQKKYVPLVVKIAPDLTAEEIQQIGEIIWEEKIDGVIATNTTLSRDGVTASPYANETGGLSGKPLLHRSTTVIRELHNVLQNKIPIIGCGGIFTPDDLNEKMSAGAELFQVYTGLVYQGPGIIQRLAKACQSVE